MSTPNNAFQPNGSHFSDAQHSTSQWNGESGDISTPSGHDGADAMSAQPNNTSAQDAIREGKQRARETMAAAGVSSDNQGAANGDSAQANGTPQLSRKRSRDGSQIPLSRSSTSGAPATADYPSHHDVLLDRAIQRDQAFAAAYLDDQERSAKLTKEKRDEAAFYKDTVWRYRQTNPGAIFGTGYRGYGNRTTEGKSQVVYSAVDKRGPPKGRRTLPISIPRKDNAQQAEQREELVPVRLDIELDKLRLRDTFTWNLHEKTIAQQHFTQYLLEDLKIPPENFNEVARQVNLEMQDQIQNYYPHIIVEDGPLEAGRPYSDHKDDELRIMIKLNITIGRITLVDQFEWDINNALNSPEEFARKMAWENALSGEFTTAIAHSIREQSQLYTRSLWLTNHGFDGRPVEDPDLRDGFLPNPIHSAFRPHQAQKDWTPYLYEMSEAELDRTETSMMREHRAQKRQLNRRGGPALPDLKDRQRTVRSLIVHSVIPGAVETFETTGIPKTRRSGRAGRRGGARTDGEVDSDDLESEDSGAESPAPSVMNAAMTGGTARTRGMRGAASAAQAAMRAGYGRSLTPESVQTTPHDTRTASRRSHLREEDTAPTSSSAAAAAAADEDTLIVKLKIGRGKLKAFWTEYEAKKRASLYPLSGYASQPPPAATASTPVRLSHVTPTSTPRIPAQSNGHQRAASSSSKQRQQQAQVTYDDEGRVDIDHWPPPDDAPVSPLPNPPNSNHH